jgi:hypothetical protein
MPRAAQKRLSRRAYRAHKLTTRLPDNQPPPLAHAPAPRGDFREWLLLLVVSFGACSAMLLILDWAARPY